MLSIIFDTSSFFVKSHIPYVYSENMELIFEEEKNI